MVWGAAKRLSLVSFWSLGRLFACTINVSRIGEFFLKAISISSIPAAFSLSTNLLLVDRIQPHVVSVKVLCQSLFPAHLASNTIRRPPPFTTQIETKRKVLPWASRGANFATLRLDISATHFNSCPKPYVPAGTLNQPALSQGLQQPLLSIELL
jgi:hypothetical protein